MENEKNSVENINNLNHNIIISEIRQNNNLAEMTAFTNSDIDKENNLENQTFGYISKIFGDFKKFKTNNQLNYLKKEKIKNKNEKKYNNEMNYVINSPQTTSNDFHVLEDFSINKSSNSKDNFINKSIKIPDCNKSKKTLSCYFNEWINSVNINQPMFKTPNIAKNKNKLQELNKIHDKKCMQESSLSQDIQIFLRKMNSTKHMCRSREKHEVEEEGWIIIDDYNHESKFNMTKEINKQEKDIELKIIKESGIHPKNIQKDKCKYFNKTGCQDSCLNDFEMIENFDKYHSEYWVIANIDEN